jgi:uncharacterized protein (UPF0276 family)
MQLAINYSPQAAELQQAGTIHVDRFKCPNWEWLIDQARVYSPVYVHFELTAGNNSLASKDWESIRRLMAETQTPCLNLHLAPTLTDFGFEREPLSSRQQRQVMDRMIRDVAMAAQRIGAERVIVENIPYRGRGANDSGKAFLRPSIEPDAITHILQATGTGFLFDLSHARITAGTLGMDEKIYIEALPLSRIREVHVTGIRMVDGEQRDHFELLPEDWKMFEWFVSKIQSGAAAEPEMVAFEYGGVGDKFAYRSDTGIIAAQVPKLREIIEKKD